MSININDIYVSQWLKNNTLKNYCKNIKHPHFNLYPHHIFHIEDSINYRILLDNNFKMYEKYITDTVQPEHSVEIYKNLLENFDINKMGKINIEYEEKIKKYIVRDGVHRLCILVLKDIFKNKEIPLEYLNII